MCYNNLENYTQNFLRKRLTQPALLFFTFSMASQCKNTLFYQESFYEPHILGYLAGAYTFEKTYFIGADGPLRNSIHATEMPLAPW